MKNRGSTLILTNLGVHLRNIHTKFEANPCSGLREEIKKVKSSRQRRRWTQGDCQECDDVNSLSNQ